MCCGKDNKKLVTLRVFIIFVCVLHLVRVTNVLDYSNTFIESFYDYYIKLQIIGGFGLFSYAVSGEYSNILNVAAPILAIVIGIFGIVAASKRNLWLVGIVSYSEFTLKRNAISNLLFLFFQFAVTMLILMSLYAASAASIAQNWDKSIALIEAQLQVAGLDTSSPSFKPYQDSVASAFVIVYSVAVTMAIIEALTFLASILYFYLVRRLEASNSIA